MIRTYLKESLGLTEPDINTAMEQLSQTPVTTLNKLIFLPDQIQNIISDNKLLHKEKKLPEQQTENGENAEEMNNKSSKTVRARFRRGALLESNQTSSLQRATRKTIKELRSREFQQSRPKRIH